MKNIITAIITILLSSVIAEAQDFNKAMASAKSAYNSNKLEDTHFALQQAMQEIDITIGKEILKLLPSKMGVLPLNPKEDNVTSNISFVGATIHRVYGNTEKSADLSIISNSPLIAMMNTVLNAPLMGGLINDGKSKTIKVQGYKARLEKQTGLKEGMTDYDLQIPLGSTLLTFKVTNTTDAEIQDMANSIPLQQIAKLIN